MARQGREKHALNFDLIRRIDHRVSHLLRKGFGGNRIRYQMSEYSQLLK